jgi:4-aminobutyrate aminotransferase-like enzyme
VAISPPLVITREEVDHAADVIGEALEAVARDLPAAAPAG